MTRIIELSFTLQEPTAITDGSAESAGHRTLSWIPGTSILGASVAAFGIAPEDERFARLFLDGGVRFLDAVPAVEGLRSRPRPLSLAWSNDGEILDRGLGRSPDGPFDRARLGFVGSDPTSSVEPDRVVRDHVGIDADTRTARDGVLFSYEALPADTILTGFVLADDDALADLVLERYADAGRLRIGRSRRGGYGRVSVNATPVDTLPEWESASTARPSRIVLASDYCPPAGVSPLAALRSELAGHGVTVTESWCETRVVRGFRGVWGLPRPPIEVLCRGTTLRVETSRDLPDSIRVQGLGRRRHEGFGRLAFDVETRPSAPSDSRAPAPSIDRASSDPAGVATSITLLAGRATNRMAVDIAQAACDSTRADRLVEILAGSARLRSSQLSNLRSAIGDHRVMDRPEVVADWFKGVQEKSRGDAWRKTIVPALDGERREATIGEVVSAFIGDAGAPWAHAATTVCTLAGRNADLGRFESAHTRHRLASLFIDGIVHRVARERRRHEEVA